MTRTALKLLFVAILALLATQAVSVPMCGASPCDKVARAEAPEEQRAIFDLPRVPAFAEQPVSSYVSPVPSAPDTALPFQLPPPVLSLAS